MQMITPQPGRLGTVVTVMRRASICFLVIWPFFAVNVIMLSDNPNVGSDVAFFRTAAHYLTLVFPLLAAPALWFDRRKVRGQIDVKSRLKLWLIPVVDLFLIAGSIVAVFRFGSS